MRLTSQLPLGSIFFKHWHTDDTEVGVVVAKAGFALAPDGSLSTIRPAPDLNFEDAFAGDPAEAPLVSEQDIAPAKTGTDIIIAANAHSPDGQPHPDWQVGISIPERLNYVFQVRGPAHWQSGMLGWRMTDPEPVSQVPLTYALAYGGAAMGDPEAQSPDIHMLNPAGQGFSTQDTRKGKAPFPAPQIGELGEFMANDITKSMMVHGVGPIAKSWLPRRSLAGTFDDVWEKTRHPRMPKDYDLGFWNAAHPRLQLRPFLNGDETITLQGMTPGGSDRHVTLPGFQVMLAANGDAAQETINMVLDTVMIDIDDGDPAKHTLFLLWRALVVDPARFTHGALQSMKLG